MLKSCNTQIITAATVPFLRFSIGIWAALTVFICLSANAGAQVVTVTTAADVVDIDAQTGTVSDLPGPDGEVSLSEALIATNNTPGHQTIGFAVPEGGWLLQFLFPGRVVFTSITGFYWRANDEVTIDGTTQTVAIGDTNPDGGEIVIYGEDLYLNAPNCTLIGFDSSSVSLGSDSLIQGNTGNMNITVGGSRTLVDGNTGGTIRLTGDDNVVVGNTVQRVRVLSGNNNIIGGPNPADRNFLTGYGTWSVSSGLPSGTTLQLFDTNGTVIENNYIGTTPDGLAQGNPASTIGVSFEGTNHDAVVRDNLVAGIKAVGIGQYAGLLFGYGVILWGPGGGSNIELTGNTIGLDANGAPLLGSVWGIDVGNANGSGTYTDVRIEGNVVAGHVLNGITVGRQIPNVRILENSIHSNGWLGIDLIPTGFGYGVTPNDPLDADTGGNGLQNFPDILDVASNGLVIQVVGQLHSEPLGNYSLEFFASPVCDPSGFGQGEIFLGSTSVSTDSAGNAVFDSSFPALAPAGWVVTSTATREPTIATSEFSACVEITAATVDPTLPEGMKLLDGVQVGGQMSDLFASDDQYLQLDPSPTNNRRKQKVHVITQSTSPFGSPTGFGFRLSSRMLGGPSGDVIQTVELMNYVTGDFELVDTRSVANIDETVQVVPTGDPGRFVQPITNEITAGISWKSESFSGKSHAWSIDLDEAIWLIDE